MFKKRTKNPKKGKFLQDSDQSALKGHRSKSCAIFPISGSNSSA